MANRNKKDFLPKRVGRIKIPKRIRRGVLGAAIGSAAGQAVIAALILKAGAQLADRIRSAQHDWDDADELFGHDDPPAKDAHGEDAAFDSHAPAPPARTGPRLNLKHALGQAALAFLVGLAHPKRPKRRGKRRPRELPAPSPGPNGAHPSP